MASTEPDASAGRPDEVTDLHGDLEPDPDPPTVAEVRDEQQIIDLQGGDATGGAPG